MKKLILLVGLLVAAGIPLMAADIGGVMDLNYFMETPKDDNDDEPSEGYFGMVSTKLTVKQELGENLDGFLKLALIEAKSDGIDSTAEPTDLDGDVVDSGADLDGDGVNDFVIINPVKTEGDAYPVQIEEIWVAKKDAFDVEGLGLKFGKMEVPGNLDYDTGTTHTLSNMFEIDFTWGLNGSYFLGEGKGTVNLTLIEGMGGLDETPGEDPEDEDSGLFQSLVAQWDTGENAFEVEGLRLVVAYAMIASDDDADDGSNISIGGTYNFKGMDVPLTLGLEIDMSTNVYSAKKGTMLIALNGDYDINEEFSAGLSYEMWTFNKDEDIGLDDSFTISRMALRGSYKIADNTKVRLEYADLSTDEEGAKDEFGGSTIALGVLAKF
jgi:hypothetical protein